MYGAISTSVAEFIDKLERQKQLYNDILALSEREQQLIDARPVSLPDILELLHSKDALVNEIQSIEQDVIRQRSVIAFQQLSDDIRQRISGCIEQIGMMLRSLLDKDSQNEELLRAYLSQHTRQAPVNVHQAMRSYGAYAR